MPTREVVQIGHPSLRLNARYLTLEDITKPETQRTIDDMVETMRAATGVGLAAPQIDLPWRVFVAEAEPSQRRPDIERLELLCVINPQLVVLDQALVSDWEGCLSIEQGTMVGVVKRYHRVRVEGLNREGREVAHELVGFHARIAQHEVDHLDGILFFDRIYERLSPRESPIISTRENRDRYLESAAPTERTQSALNSEDKRSGDSEREGI